MAYNDVIIIGSGLFGSVIAKELQTQGRQTLVVDSGEIGSGSKPAACLMKPSWMSNMDNDSIKQSLKLLDRNYGVETLKFSLGKLEPEVLWCDPAKILSGEVKRAKANLIEKTKRGWKVKFSNWHDQKTKCLIVAAGVWTNSLIPKFPTIRGKAGIAFLFKKKKIEKPFIKIWAMRQTLVAFNRGDGLWVGDGNTAYIENWGSLQEQAAEDRCLRAINLDHEPEDMERLFGIRPVAPERKPFLLEEVDENLWVATGGARNGTIAAGYCAYEIARKSK